MADTNPVCDGKRRRKSSSAESRTETRPKTAWTIPGFSQTRYPSLFSGNIPVHFYYQDTKQQLLVPESMYAQDGEYLKNKLIEFLGEPNVVYK